MQPVPQDLIDLSIDISQTQSEDERAGSEVVLLFARLCNLFASSRDAKLQSREEVLAHAISLDNDLISWSQNLPPSYNYTTEPARPSSNAFTGYCEVYSSLFSAEVWNLYRSARLGVNGLIVEQQSLLDLEHTQQQQQAYISAPPSRGRSDSATATAGLDVRLAVLESLRNDICAGTPFMLGRHSGDRPLSDIPLCRRTPVMHHLLYILKTAGITKEMYNWAMAQVAELTPDVEGEGADGAICDPKTLTRTAK